MTDRMIVTVSVFDWGEYDEVGTLNEFLAKIEESASSHPPEYRAEMKVTLDGEYTHLRCEYERPETDKELEARAADEARCIRMRENEERQRYLRLKAKFEP